jgi:hypothetical protein
MIEAPHTLHTYSRSTLYLYEVFLHLLQWLVFIWMQPKPDMCFASQSQWQSLESLLVSHLQLQCAVVGYDWGILPTSYSYQVFVIECIIIFYLLPFSHHLLWYMTGLLVLLYLKSEKSNFYWVHQCWGDGQTRRSTAGKGKSNGGGLIRRGVVPWPWLCDWRRR